MPNYKNIIITPVNNESYIGNSLAYLNVFYYALTSLFIQNINKIFIWIFIIIFYFTHDLLYYFSFKKKCIDILFIIIIFTQTIISYINTYFIIFSNKFLIKKNFYLKFFYLNLWKLKLNFHKFKQFNKNFFIINSYKIPLYFLFLGLVLFICFLSGPIILEYVYIFIILIYSIFIINFSFLKIFLFFFILFVEFFLQIIYNLYYYVICTLIYVNYESLYYLLSEFLWDFTENSHQILTYTNSILNGIFWITNILNMPFIFFVNDAYCELIFYLYYNSFEVLNFLVPTRFNAIGVGDVSWYSFLNPYLSHIVEILFRWNWENFFFFKFFGDPTSLSIFTAEGTLNWNYTLVFSAKLFASLKCSGSVLFNFLYDFLGLWLLNHILDILLSVLKQFTWSCAILSIFYINYFSNFFYFFSFFATYFFLNTSLFCISVIWQYVSVAFFYYSLFFDWCVFFFVFFADAIYFNEIVVGVGRQLTGVCFGSFQTLYLCVLYNVYFLWYLAGAVFSSVVAIFLNIFSWVWVFFYTVARGGILSAFVECFYFILDFLNIIYFFSYFFSYSYFLFGWWVSSLLFLQSPLMSLYFSYFIVYFLIFILFCGYWFHCVYRYRVSRLHINVDKRLVGQIYWITYFQKFFIVDRYLRLIRVARAAGFDVRLLNLFRASAYSKRRPFNRGVLEFVPNNRIFLYFISYWGNFYILIRLLQLFTIKMLCYSVGESRSFVLPHFPIFSYFYNFFFVTSRWLIVFYRKVLNAVFLVKPAGPIKFPVELKNNDSTSFLLGLTVLSFSTLILLVFENCYWLTEKSGFYLQKRQADALSRVNIYSENSGSTGTPLWITENFRLTYNTRFLDEFAGSRLQFTGNFYKPRLALHKYFNINESEALMCTIINNQSNKSVLRFDTNFLETLLINDHLRFFLRFRFFWFLSYLNGWDYIYDFDMDQSILQFFLPTSVWSVLRFIGINGGLSIFFEMLEEIFGVYRNFWFNFLPVVSESQFVKTAYWDFEWAHHLSWGFSSAIPRSSNRLRYSRWVSNPILSLRWHYNNYLKSRFWYIKRNASPREVMYLVNPYKVFEEISDFPATYNLIFDDKVLRIASSYPKNPFYYKIFFRPKSLFGYKWNTDNFFRENSDFYTTPLYKSFYLAKNIVDLNFLRQYNHFFTPIFSNRLTNEYIGVGRWSASSNVYDTFLRHFYYKYWSSKQAYSHKFLAFKKFQFFKKFRFLRVKGDSAGLRKSTNLVRFDAYNNDFLNSQLAFFFKTFEINSGFFFHKMREKFFIDLYGFSFFRDFKSLNSFWLSFFFEYSYTTIGYYCLLLLDYIARLALIFIFRITEFFLMLNFPVKVFFPFSLKTKLFYYTHYSEFDFTLLKFGQIDSLGIFFFLPRRNLNSFVFNNKFAYMLAETGATSNTYIRY